MGRLAALVLVLLGIGHAWAQPNDDGLRKFEYRHSFKGPNVADKEGRVPCWNIYGSAIGSSDQIRLTPSIRSKKGQAWNKFEFAEEWWEVEMVFRVTGRGRVGADGLAFWFTETVGVDGPVFGSSDHWKGLGVFFDSFDNDGAQNNPYVLLVPNDGTKTYDHSSDGGSQAVGGCMRDFRNRPYPPRARITYYRNELMVYYDPGSSAQPRYELCAHSQGIRLPPKGYFGLSAATGGLADDHDVIAFKVSSIRTPATDTPEEGEVPTMSPDQYKLYEDDFEKKSEELQQQKDAYYKDHPDKKPDEYEDWEKEYEDPTDQKLRQILESQSSLRELLMQIQLNMASGTASAVASALHDPNKLQQPVMTGTPGEYASTLADLQRQLQQITGEQASSKRLLEEIQSRSSSGNMDAGPPGPADTQPVEVQELAGNVNKLQIHIGNVVTLMESLRNAVEQKTGAGSSACVSSTMFFLAVGAQLVVFLAVFLLTSRQKQAQQKKFF